MMKLTILILVVATLSVCSGKHFIPIAWILERKIIKLIIKFDIASRNFIL